eukprot:CAMPEP_0176495194 /NCGR_PEP_ID=MMETSP0200_2-20121128/10519_1 /TAXON_ID=947934 /ORGANISM="Chaetoceros sp., Strain GSL56" /LENGTH=542 /DNA_ID=CAMNT_0017893041 /DNA_START=546 /DNA_END=2175 /DNA_ORIENTATION=-
MKQDKKQQQEQPQKEEEEEIVSISNDKESPVTITKNTNTPRIKSPKSPKSSNTPKQKSARTIRPNTASSSSSSTSRPSLSPCKSRVLQQQPSYYSTRTESSSSLAPLVRTNRTRPTTSPHQEIRRPWEKTMNKSPKRASGPISNTSKNGDETMINQQKIEQMRNDRRRKSVNVLRNSAQSNQIRQMFDMSMYENIASTTIDQVVTSGMAEERLKNILTKAKESGMTADEIFSFFNGGNPNTTKITKDSFVASLEKLGGTFLALTDDELTNIVKKFDMNEDGKISIAEFKNYCYFQIPSIAWKAERTRLEKSGEMKMLQAQLSRRFKPGKCDDGNACGEEVYRTSKFFWKTNNNIEKVYNERLNVLSMQLYSQAFERELPSIYVCKNKVDHQHKQLKDDVTKAVQKIEGRTDDQEHTKRNAMWDSIAKYLVERLKLWERGVSPSGEIRLESEESSQISQDEQYVPYLCKLPGDIFDTLSIQKPSNLDSPPPIVSGSSITEGFEKKMESFRLASRKARSSRRSAQGLSDLISSVMTNVNASFET